MDTATAATIADLRQQLSDARSYIDGQDVRSDYRNVTEMRAALDATQKDNAALYTAKAKLIDERNACLRELDAARQELADRNAYAERLLAENVRLSNEAAFMRGFINNEDVRSDFQTVTAMRQALDRERERCGVLEREVKAWHAAEHLRKDEPHNEFMRLAEARARTRETHALDPAKFEGKP